MMKSKTQKISLFLIVFTFFGIAMRTDSFAQSKAQKIDNLLTEYTKYRRFNGTVLVAEKGKVILKKGYGLANMEWNIPNAPDTKFRIASITKPFTAMVILKLVEEGKISLESKLSDYLPYYRKDTGSKITIHQLLTHTAGVLDYHDIPTFFKEESRNTHKPKDFILKFCSHDPIFEPGEKYSYSSSGYFILGAIIEEVTGKPYAEALRENILDPLGLKNTCYDDMEIMVLNRAAGYAKKGMGYKIPLHYDMSIQYASGSLYSTAQDMYILDRALSENKLFSKVTYDLMFTSHAKLNAESSYGYGWEIGKTQFGQQTIGHTGSLKTFISIVQRIPEDGHLIVLFMNTGLDALHSSPLTRIYDTITSILYDKPYDLPKIPISEIVFDDIKNGKDIDNILTRVRAARENSQDKYTTSSREFFYIGRALVEEKLYENALKFLDLGLEFHPDSPILYHAIGEAYMEKGEKTMAIKSFAKSIELSPNFPWPMEKLKELKK